MSNEDARKLFVAGLPDSITEDVLRTLFEATGGTVSEISLPKDRATGRPRGFGFVTLSTSEEAQAARDSLDGSIQAGKSISVRPFQAEPPKREPKAEPRTVSGSHPAAGQTYLQLAATSQHEADIMVDVLRKKNFRAMAAEIDEKPGTFRVLVGPITDTTANKMRADLQGAGFPGNAAIRRTF